MRKIILSLFAIALLSRAIVALLQIGFGINNQINLDVYLYGSINPGFEIYHDFYFYYVPQLVDLSKGLVPYVDFGYSYPPLFLYVLYPFFLLAGKYAASIPILLADAATAPVIFAIVRKFSTYRISLIAGLGYAVSPFFLLYEGYLWFSSQPMTFFVLLSMYLLFSKRPLYSTLVLAVAILFKQEVVFILPIYLIWYLKFYRKDVLKSIGIMLATLVSVSLPFLAISSSDYISSLSYATLAPGYIPLNATTTSPQNSTEQSILANAASHTLNCSTFGGTWRSLVCNFGGLNYTDIKSVPSAGVIFTPAFLNDISPIIALVLIVVIFYYSFLIRNSNVFVLITSAFALVIFIFAFDFEIHTIYRYYLVPVYALTLAASNSTKLALVSLSIPLISLFLPSGNIQLLPPLFGILLIMILVYQKKSLTDTTYFSGAFTP
jgi:hypothetical protein